LDAPVPAVTSTPVRAVRSAPAAAPTTDDWRALVSGGHFEEGLRVAERIGITLICATASEDDLLGLADAARLSGRPLLASGVLTVLRTRFPDGATAATAAFALGRIAFERRADYADAAHWFATYLDEQPDGPLMGDAVGRLVESRYRAGDRANARREAQRYLHLFPRGPYAKTAIAILAE
jgi:hypothetical protein